MSLWPANIFIKPDGAFFIDNEFKNFHAIGRTEYNNLLNRFFIKGQDAEIRRYLKDKTDAPSLSHSDSEHLRVVVEMKCAERIGDRINVGGTYYPENDSLHLKYLKTSHFEITLSPPESN